MQRLISTDWLEKDFSTKHSHKVLDLLSPLWTPTDTDETDWVVRQQGRFIPTSATLVNAPDLAWLLAEPKPTGGVQLKQGLSVMEQGAFLRSYGAQHDLLSFKTGLPTGQPQEIKASRHLGSEVAQRVLASKLKAMGLMEWTPDGICISKLESSDDADANRTFDTQSGQLFNIGVKGPCITTTWTGNPAMQTLPMDKVFVLIVGTVFYKLDNTVNTLDADMKKFETAVGTTNTDGSFKECVKDPYNRANPFQNASLAQFQAEFPAKAEGGVDTGVFQADSDKIRNQPLTGDVLNAMMTDFRLQRVTSSYLVNNSHYDGTPGSRCGLKIGYDKTTRSGYAEYYVGGWCIGTVMDAAASRAMSHNAVRVAPSTMAINLDVNVAWWSADRLYQHYQGVDAGDYALTTPYNQQFRNVVQSRTGEQLKQDKKRPRQKGPDRDD